MHVGITPLTSRYPTSIWVQEHDIDSREGDKLSKENSLESVCKKGTSIIQEQHNFTRTHISES